MAYLALALFNNQQSAGEAIAELKEKGYTNDISLIAKDEQSGELSSHQVKKDVSDGVAMGAATGAGAGVLLGILAGLSNIVIPGVGPFLIGGSLAATWGVAGGLLGAFAGGIVGALVDIGIPQERARIYEDAIRNGEVFVSTSTTKEKTDDVEQIYKNYGATDVEIISDDDLTHTSESSTATII